MKMLIRSVLVCALLFPVIAHAQVVTEEKIKVGKEHINGFTAVSDKYSKGQVKAILAERMAEAGLNKHSKKSKFYTYTDVIWPITGRDKVNIWYKVTGTKHGAKIYFIASKGFDNYISSATDVNRASDIYNFLAQIDTAIALRETIDRKEKEAKSGNAAADQNKENIKPAATVKKPNPQQPQKLNQTAAY